MLAICVPCSSVPNFCSRAVGVNLDESTDRGLQKQLIVMLVILTADGEVVTAYGDMPSITAGDAGTVHAALEKCLQDLGVPTEKVCPTQWPLTASSSRRMLFHTL